MSDDLVSQRDSSVLRFPEFPRPAARVELWEAPDKPDQETLRAELVAQGYQALRWRQRPGEGYPPHAHIYPETIWLVSGSLTVVLPSEDRILALEAGDRIEMPQGYLHGTMAGPDGAVYLVATR